LAVFLAGFFLAAGFARFTDACFVPAFLAAVFFFAGFVAFFVPEDFLGAFFLLFAITSPPLPCATAHLGVAASI
jgi:hypothetical protein